MICKEAKIDPLRSASKAIMQRNTSKRTHKGPRIFPEGRPIGPFLEWEKIASQLARVQLGLNDI